MIIVFKIFFKYGSYQCKCPAGFRGKRCDIPTNPCDSSVCENGGRCFPYRDNFYACECRPGYSMDFLKYDISGPE